jgi:hypothetical protein
MKSHLKSLLPSLVFLAAAAAFASAGWVKSRPASCETKHAAMQADGCCSKHESALPEKPAHACCDTNQSAQAHH